MSTTIGSPKARILAAVCVGVATVALAGCGTTSALDLTTGDCIEMPDKDNLDSGFTLTSVKKVKCEEPHDAQIVHTHELTGYDNFPGEDEMMIVAQDECLTGFEDFVGVPLYESSVDLYPLMPTEDSWKKAKDRTINCIAISTVGSLEASLEDTNK